jgi:hypothetical protein
VGFDWGNCGSGHEKEWASGGQNFANLIVAGTRMNILAF